jgi:hypothetical protein
MWPSLGEGPIAIDTNLRQPYKPGADYIYYAN